MIRPTPGAALCAVAFAIAMPAFSTPAVAQSGSQSQTGSAQTDPTATNTPVGTTGAAPARPTTSGYPAEGEGNGVTTNGYNISRWAEDWTKYRDPKKRDDFLDRLKYLPIDEAAGVYVTLSGEVRARVNLTSNPALKDVASQRLDILRVVGGVDLHLGEHVRVYGELANGTVGGENTGAVAGSQRNNLFAQQLFGEVYGKVGDVEVGVRGGRQEFTDGISLLVSARDNNALFFTLDGVRAYAKAKTVRADVFDLNFVSQGNGGIRDDRTDSDNRFTGASLGFVVPTDWFGGSKLYFDPFVWRLRNRDAAWGGVSGREVRSYHGGRLWGTAGPLTVDYTLVHEGGKFDGRDISAWQAFAAQTYRIGKGATAPRIGVRGDYGSGGGAFGTGKLKTAFSPFGNNIYYTYGVFVAPINFLAVAPNVSFTPVGKVRVTAEYEFMWRSTDKDAVYRSNGTPYLGTQLVGGSKIGDAARLQAVWTITPRLSFTGRLEHVAAGNVLTRAGYSSSDFATGWLSFRF
jgi:hypothetical protein